MNSQDRILFILEKLAKGNSCTKELSLEIFGTDDSKHLRLIQNDIKKIKRYFGDKIISTKRGCYKFLNIPQTIKNLYDSSPKELVEIFEFVALFDAKMLNIFKQSEPAFVKRLKKDIKTIYKLHSMPFEEIKNRELWHTLKDAIKYRNYIDIAYHRNKLVTYNKVKPLKILFAQNNWYLATLINEEDRHGHGYGFTFFRINHIIGVNVDTKTYQENIVATNFLENLQSLFETFGEKKYKVELLASKEISSFFKQKKYLKSQTITRSFDDGSIELSFYVTNSLEIIPLIKQWLPHLKVISPKDLKDEISTILESYLKNL